MRYEMNPSNLPNIHPSNWEKIEMKNILSLVNSPSAYSLFPCRGTKKVLLDFEWIESNYSF
jgi:hypothetical protein